jgi:exosortase
MASVSVSTTVAQKERADRFPLLVLGGLTVVLLWSYWNALTEAAVYWQGPQYSHGFLIPLFTVLLLWLRRQNSPDAPLIENAREKKVLITSGVLLAVSAGIYWALPSAGPLMRQVLSPIAFASSAVIVGLGATVFWTETQPQAEVPVKQHWWGVALLSFGLAARLICAHVGLDIPDMYTFVPSLLGLLLLAGGWRLFRWAGPAVAFLIFMFPLPWSVERTLLTPLQTLACNLSTFSLQTLGVEAYNGGGNRISIEGVATPLGVVDQCSGLRMATIFLALSVALVMIAKRSWWENLVILASAIPIALAVNVMRITVTGVLYLVASSELAEKVFHDWAGYMMPVVAFGLLWLELVILSHLFYEVDDEVPVPLWGRWR